MQASKIAHHAATPIRLFLVSVATECAILYGYQRWSALSFGGPFEWMPDFRDTLTHTLYAKSADLAWAPWFQVAVIAGAASPWARIELSRQCWEVQSRFQKVSSEVRNICPHLPTCHWLQEHPVGCSVFALIWGVGLASTMASGLGEWFGSTRRTSNSYWTTSLRKR